MSRDILHSTMPIRHYFDSGSFTPPSRVACAAVARVLRAQRSGLLGNPISSHDAGRRSAAYILRAQRTLGALYRMQSGDVLFCSGATEANIIALRTAILDAHRRRGIAFSDMHILVGHEEHSSIYAALQYFSVFGITSTVITSPSAQLRPDDVVQHLREHTVCLSLQYVNSQHGIVQPIARLAAACRAQLPGIFLHTDAAQATAYFDCSPETLGVDAVTIDGTKAFGPQGVGALLFRRLHRFSGLTGASGAWDIRPGTPPVALIHGFAEALYQVRSSDAAARVQVVRDALLAGIVSFSPDSLVRGLEVRAGDALPLLDALAPHLLYISFPSTHHAYLAALLDADGFAVSTTTACVEQADEALRIGVVPTTSLRAVRALLRSIQRRLSLASSDSQNRV